MYSLKKWLSGESKLRKEEETMVTEVASQAHEDWRKGREVMGNGQYEKRIKTVDRTKENEAWLKKTGQTSAVESPSCDIANTAYEDLPPQYQADNKNSATVAVRAVERHDSRRKLFNEAFIDAAAAEVHEAWIKRERATNPDREKSNPELFVPYKKLSEDEKEKDRVFVRRAIAAYASTKK